MQYRGYKTIILENLCYTELVYERINKKLKTHLSKAEIEKLIREIVKETDEITFIKKGKNIHITNHNRGICLTVNSFTKKIITAVKTKKG
ncbi:DUF3781 domain-containing protein [Sphingobacterium corticis]|uniref:DUF3781 domain-containing protein n=2 Tax=Sphingobacterium corticis TaxID=1812823 RepID=A0ABW5NIC5_9SPHI